MAIRFHSPSALLKFLKVPSGASAVRETGSGEELVTREASALRAERRHNGDIRLLAFEEGGVQFVKLASQTPGRAEEQYTFHLSFVVKSAESCHIHISKINNTTILQP